MLIEPFIVVTGVAAPLPPANLDTDVIMPKQFLKAITRDDLARGVFYDLRFDESGIERPDFVLNQEPYRQARFLVVGPNFGSGSRRAHAVWGLRQFGIRGLFGTSFASIFQDNCFRNGILPATLSSGHIARLLELTSDPAMCRLHVALESQTVQLADGDSFSFSINPLRRDDLLNGRDPIASTLRYESQIEAFEGTHWEAHPWLKPVRHP